MLVKIYVTILCLIKIQNNITTPNATTVCKNKIISNMVVLSDQRNDKECVYMVRFDLQHPLVLVTRLVEQLSHGSGLKIFNLTTS